MEKNRLVLKDGTEIINGSASRLNNQLMVRIPGNDIVNAAISFTNANKTETIICYRSVYKYTFTGFTSMFSIQYNSEEDFIEIWLSGENVSTDKDTTVPEEYLPESMRIKKG